MKKHFETIGISKEDASKIPLTLLLAVSKPKNNNRITVIFETEAHQSVRVPLRSFYKKTSRYI